MGYGSEGHLGVCKQNSWAVPASSWHFIPIVNEGLVTNIEVLAQESILARYDEPPIREGVLTVAGDIAMELNPIDQGHFLRGVLGVYSSSVAQSGYVYLHAFTPKQTRFDANAALPPYTATVYRSVDEAFQFTDCQFNTMEINVTAGGIAKMSVGVIGRTSSLMNAATASYHTEAVYTWDAASISITTSGVGDLEDITISVNNNLEGISFLDTTKRRARILRNGFREVRVNGTVDLPDLDEYDEFRAQSERRLVLTLTGTEVRSGYKEYIEIDIPKFRYETFPVNISNPNRLSVGFTGRGIYHTGSLTTLKITMQNTLASY